MHQFSKTVLITGCSQGIGLASVKGFLENDYTVLAHCRKVNEDLNELHTTHPNQLYLFEANLENPDQIDQMWNQINDKKINPGILVNNAGTKGSALTFEDVSLEQLNKVMQVNLSAPFLLSQKVIPHMRENSWGRIINLSSIGTKFGGGPQTSDYCISKFALEGLTQVLNKNYSKHNILCNTLKVGVTQTNFHKDIIQKNFQKREQLIPLGRSAKATEIFEMIFFLASEKNSFTSGATISISGGE